MKQLVGEGNAVARVSEDELINYLEENPNLLGWDAILAYDRNKTNSVLLQEYIGRFNSASWLEPMSFEASSTPSVVERVIDYQLDAPRLSFENADLESSRADLKMRVVGGKQLTIENPNNPKQFQITRLKMADALNGPVLHMRIRLEEVNITVNESRVGLDLSKGTEFYLTYADTTEEDTLGGLKFKEKFDQLSSDKKTFEISRLKRTDSVIKPTRVVVRTQPSPDTHLFGTTAGDGAVLCFVGMDGFDEAQASLPSRGFQYLLPGNVGDYSANLILKNAYVLAQYIRALTASFPGFESALVFEYDEGILSSTNGYVIEDGFRLDLKTDYKFSYFKNQVAFSEFYWEGGDMEGNAKLSIEQGKMIVDWQGTSSTVSDILYQPDDHISGESVERFRSVCKFSAKTELEFCMLESGRVGLQALNTDVSTTVTFEDGWTGQYLFPMLAVDGVGHVKRAFDELVKAQFSKFQVIGFELDLFLLNNVLFRGDQSFKPTSVGAQGALMTLGQLAPDSTRFQVAPVETVVAAGGKTYPFKTDPAGVEVTWAVKSLPGETGNPGTIDAKSGVYTSPPASALVSKHARVIVTATAKSGSASSQALVGIVSRDLGLDPLVMMANHGVSGYKVRATPLDPTETLTFSMSANALGKVIDDPNADPDVPYSKLYVPPAATAQAMPGPAAIAPEWLEYRKSKAWRAEEDIDQLLAVEQVQAVGSKGSRQEVQVLLPLENLTNWFTYEGKGAGVQLTFWASGKKGDYNVAPDDTTWYLVKGSGTFEDGLYTPPSNTEEAYAVVAAVEADERNWYWAIAILPVPFVTAQRFISMTEEVRP
ncbi:hypothetical protein [Pseudomonas entomophila]|uniref:hypothetical protein n=1 Tax=Pseudomonas entomophila TaxID=312306 RepID=UPI003EB9D8C4